MDRFGSRISTAKYCFECHGEKTQKGGIEVQQLNSADSALRHHRFLENIAEQVESGDMPPDDGAGGEGFDNVGDASDGLRGIV